MKLCIIWIHKWEKRRDMHEENAYNHNHQIKTCEICGIKKQRWYT